LSPVVHGVGRSNQATQADNAKNKRTFGHERLLIQVSTAAASSGSSVALKNGRSGIARGFAFRRFARNKGRREASEVHPSAELTSTRLSCAYKICLTRQEGIDQRTSDDCAVPNWKAGGERSEEIAGSISANNRYDRLGTCACPSHFSRQIDRDLLSQMTSI
jgi:hypothetical protein